MLENSNYEILLGDSLKKLKELPDKCIQTCITSPPYYALRDYGTGHWEGGDPNCPHYRTSKYSENTATGHKHMMEAGEAVGDAIYKTVCPLCGAVRVDEQIGLEETPEEYINKLVAVFHEVKRVLKDDGTLWVNIGDSYANNNPSNHNFEGTKYNSRANNSNICTTKAISKESGLKQKDLIGIPWMLAFALRADGWYLRQDIIWRKTNCMPEPAKDRCVKSHEYIFLLSKQSQYYFDYKAIQTPSLDVSKKRNESFEEDNVSRLVPEMPSYEYDRYQNSKYSCEQQGSSVRQGMHKNRGDNLISVRNNLPDKEMFLKFIREKDIDEICSTGVNRTTCEHWFRRDEGFSYPSVEDWNLCRDTLNDKSDEFYFIDKDLLDVVYESDDVLKNFYGYSNKRDVWDIPCSSYKGAHFATYPEKLIEPCILAGSAVGDIVLDPFNGSGTTGAVAMRHGRKYVGVELNSDYKDLTIKRFEELEGIVEIETNESESVKVRKESLF